MENLANDLVEWMTALAPAWAYTIILVIAFGENVLPPIPGDLVVVLGGYLVGIGRLNFAIVVLLSTLGGAFGFMAMYAIGYRIGDAVLDPHRLRWLPKRQIHQVRDWLKKWGYGVVAANRFLSGARSVIALTVGMAKMDALHTTAFATLSAAIWTLLITYAGYKVGENWEMVIEYLRTYGRYVFIIIMLFIMYKAVKAYRYSNSEA